MCIIKISTDISLKEVVLNDATAIWQAIDNHRDYLRTWLPFVDRLSKMEDEADFLRSVLEVPYQERNLTFLIEVKGKLAGLIGFTVTDLLNHRTEIGYWLLPEYQKQGIMTACVKQLCRWAADQRAMNRIQIKCAEGNLPSNAIPLRLGFQLEGTEREGELLVSGHYVDINVYSILKKEILTWKE